MFTRPFQGIVQVLLVGIMSIIITNVMVKMIVVGVADTEHCKPSLHG